MSETKGKSQQSAVQTTGHAWDGDIQEFNNPLPTWWLWSFYASVVFAIIYWIFFPAWPIGGSYTKGVMNNITFVNDAGVLQTSHWNTRARLLRELQEGDAAAVSKVYLEKVAKTSYSDILQDAEMMTFARSVAKGIFGDNCTPCHGAGAAGVIGLFPNLADDDWLWGGTPEEIEASIQHGRFGFMPAFKAVLDDKQLDDVTGYVLSLSGHEIEQGIIKRGRDIFRGKEGGCYYCHTSAATGLKSQGAANLTDAVWTVADVIGADSLEAKNSAVRNVIEKGVQRRMPPWSERLTPEQIKLLTVYVHELGGGQ